MNINDLQRKNLLTQNINLLDDGKVWLIEVDTFELTANSVKRFKFTTNNTLTVINKISISTSCEELNTKFIEGGTSSSGSDILSQIVNSNRTIAPSLIIPLALYEENTGEVLGGVELFNPDIINPGGQGNSKNVGDGGKEDLNVLLALNTTYHFIVTNSGSTTGKTHMNIILSET